MSDSKSIIRVPSADELASAVRAFDADWGAVDDVLYRVCRDHPDHTERRSVMAKAVLIGRAYSAGIERLVDPPKGGQAVTKIGDCLWNQRAEVDAIIDKLRGIEEPLSPDDMKTIVRQHGRLDALLTQNLTRGRSPRSFVSKYLHFHCPVVPIFDDYCLRSLTRLVRWTESAKPFEAPAGADDQYLRFCVRFMRLYAASWASGVDATVKDLDALLWRVPTAGAVPPLVDSPQPSIEDRYRARAEFGSTYTIDDLWTPPDESLTDWREILGAYGLSFDGYAYALAVWEAECPDVAREVWERRRREGRFTSSFARLRCALFFMQRAVRNNEQSPDWRPSADLECDVRELYGAICEAWRSERGQS